MDELVIAITTRNARHGVAFSQAMMGRSTPERYQERCKEIDAEFAAACLVYFGTLGQNANL